MLYWEYVILFLGRLCPRRAILLGGALDDRLLLRGIFLGWGFARGVLFSGGPLYKDLLSGTFLWTPWVVAFPSTAAGDGSPSITCSPSNVTAGPAPKLLLDLLLAPHDLGTQPQSPP